MKTYKDSHNAGDDLECPCCDKGILEVNSSPFENEAGEDDATYWKCNICGTVFNEQGVLLYEGKS
jgi:rubredoxin